MPRGRGTRGAGGGGASSSPVTFPAISNLELRYDMLAAGGVTEAPKGRGLPRDLSTNGRHAVAAGANALPFYHKTAFNRGYPCLSFNGVDQKIKVVLPAIAQPFSVVALIQNYEGGTGAINANWYNGGGVVGFLWGGGSDWTVYGGAQLSGATHYTKATANLLPDVKTNPGVKTDIYNGVNSVNRYNAYETTGNAGAGTIAAGDFYIGGDSTTSFAKIMIGSFMIFSKLLSAQDRADLEGYFEQAWLLALMAN